LKILLRLRISLDNGTHNRGSGCVIFDMPNVAKVPTIFDHVSQVSA
jgi:hypothetical protein